jgi:O-antigen ligase
VNSISKRKKQKLKREKTSSFLKKVGWILMFIGIPVGSAAAAIPFLFFAKVIEPAKKREKNIVVVLAILFVLFFLPSLINAQNKLLALGSVLSLALMIYAVFLGVNYIVLRGDFFNLLIKILIISATFSSVYALTIYFSNFDFIRFVTRAKTLFAGENTLGGVTVFSIIWTLTYLTHTGNRRKLWLWAVLLLMILALVFSFSRGAWLGAIGAMISYGFWEKKARLKVAVALFIAGIVLLSLPSLRGRLASIANLSHHFTLERIYIWKATWEMIKAHPLLGIGMDNYSIVYEKYIFEGAEISNPSSAHNIFLNIWVEGGLLALLSFTGIVVITLLKGFRLIRSLSGLSRAVAVASFSALLGILIHNQVDCILYSMHVGPIFWLLVGMIIYGEKFSIKQGQFF